MVVQWRQFDDAHVVSSMLSAEVRDEEGAITEVLKARVWYERDY